MARLALPAIEIMFMHYPQGGVSHIARLIGGTVQRNLENEQFQSYKDTCAIRVSRSLNYSGKPIGYAGPKVRTNRGRDKKRYVYSTRDIRLYLNSRFGKPVKFPVGTEAKDVRDYYGIIAFGYLHIDLWDGYQNKCAGNDYFGGREILIWETHSLLESRI